MRLFFAAFLMLFLELVLIRYLAGNVWNMGYFPNLVLMGVFIGMGLGFVCHQSVAERLSPVLVQGAALLLALLVIFLYCKHPTVPGFSQWLGSIGGEVCFTASPGASSPWDAWIFLGLFLSVMLIFALLGTAHGQILPGASAPLRAYTLDVAGSCVGILAFMLCRLVTAPRPGAGSVVLIPLFLVVLHGSALYRHLLGRGGAGASPLLWCGSRIPTLLSQPDACEPRRRPLVAVSEGGIHCATYTAHLCERHRTSTHGASRLTFTRILLPQTLSIPCLPQAAAGTGRVGDWCRFGQRCGSSPVERRRQGGRRGNRSGHCRPGETHIIRHTRTRMRACIWSWMMPGAFMSATTRKYDLIIFALTDSLVKVSPSGAAATGKLHLYCGVHPHGGALVAGGWQPRFLSTRTDCPGSRASWN